MNKTRKYLPFILIVIFWALDFASKLKYNGLIYGLDYGLYQPDGTLYTFRTLNWLGHSDAQSARMVSDWALNHSYKQIHISPESLYYKVNPLWDLYLPRLLYPALSLPFVALFGIPGMLAIPAISMLVLMLVTWQIGKYFDNELVGLSIAILFSCCLTVNRWMFIDTTDSLLVAITAIFVLFFIKHSDKSLNLVLLVILILLASFTRVSILEWLGFALVLAFSKKLKTSLILVMSAIIGFVPAAYKNTSQAILLNTGMHSFLGKMLIFPTVFARVGFYEIAELAVLDRLLLILVILGIVVSIMRWRSLSAKIFIVELIALWLTGAVNGTIGVNFRYQIPLLVFLGWTLASNFPKFYNKRDFTSSSVSKKLST